MSLYKYITTCPLDCFDCCSLVVTVDDMGEVLNIEGNKEHPVTGGFICSKGRKHMERVHHPSRLRYPMIKRGGEWKRITWDEALDTIADRIRSYAGEHGTEAIGLYSYGGASGILKNIENLFFEYIGNTTKIYGSICLGAGIAAQRLDFGNALGHEPGDIDNSKTIIIWGRNPADNNIHLVPYLKAAKERGASLILIDPLKTATAELCDRHIRIKPEGDAALACAAAKYVLDNNMYHKEFAENHTQGFDELKDYLSHISMDRLMELCGAGIDEVAMLGDKLVYGKPAAVYMGYGIQRYPYGGAAVRCLDMLAALTGNIGIPGGGANYANASAAEYIDTNPFKVCSKKPRLINRAKFGKSVKALEDPPLKLLFISRSNPVLQLPDTNAVVEALEKIEFKVSLEHFLTDTAAMADIVLPVTYFLEEEDVVVPGMWSHYIGSIGRCLNRHYEARPEYEIYTELAKKLSLKDFPVLTGEQWLEHMLKPLIDNGLVYEELREKGYIKNPVLKAVPWEEGRFATKSGRFEIIGVTELQKCLKGIAETKEERYRLLTVHSRVTLHSQHMLGCDAALPIVYIHPEDAAFEKIKAGDTIKLFNGNGMVKAVARVTSDTSKGVLYMHEGWWLKNGGSVNALTNDGVSDIGNQGIMNHCFCDIERLG